MAYYELEFGLAPYGVCLCSLEWPIRTGPIQLKVDFKLLRTPSTYRPNNVFITEKQGNLRPEIYIIV